MTSLGAAESPKVQVGGPRALSTTGSSRTPGARQATRPAWQYANVKFFCSWTEEDFPNQETSSELPNGLRIMIASLGSYELHY